MSEIYVNFKSFQETRHKKWPELSAGGLATARPPEGTQWEREGQGREGKTGREGDGGRNIRDVSHAPPRVPEITLRQCTTLSEVSRIATADATSQQSAMFTHFFVQ